MKEKKSIMKYEKNFQRVLFVLSIKKNQQYILFCLIIIS